MREKLPPFASQQSGIARFDHVESCESEEGRDSVEEFWMKAVESRCEGLMIKVGYWSEAVLPGSWFDFFKLLDSGEVLEVPSGKKDSIRRKPLPATYEPGRTSAGHMTSVTDLIC